MKKWIRNLFVVLGVIAFLFIVMVVFSDSSSETKSESGGDTEDIEKVDDEAGNENVEDVEENEEESSTEEEMDLGMLKSLYISDDIGVETESGPFELEIEGVQVTNLKTNAQGNEAYDGKDNVGMVFLHINVENTSDDSESIHPAQGSISTNTKEQVDADLAESDDVGGDFHGEVAKSGTVLFELEDSDAEDIEEITFHVNGGTTGDDISETITLDDYENLAE